MTKEKTGEPIFLIEKLWLDPMENRKPYGYSPDCYVTTEEEAEAFCNQGRRYTSKDCWGIYAAEGIPLYQYKKIPKGKIDK